MARSREPGLDLQAIGGEGGLLPEAPLHESVELDVRGDLLLGGREGAVGLKHAVVGAPDLRGHRLAPVA